MGALGVLAGGVAHDFNNMLTIVLGYSELLMGRLDAESPDRRALEEIRIAGQRASALTRQLLVFSRKQVVETRPLWPNESVEGLGKMLTQLIDEDIEMEMRLMPDTGMVSADPGQVDQVIINLAVNARDAMPQGGRLVIETENVHLDTAILSVWQFRIRGAAWNPRSWTGYLNPFLPPKKRTRVPVWDCPRFWASSNKAAAI